MIVMTSKCKAPKLARCLMNNEMIEVLGCNVKDNKVCYMVDAPDFFVFPDWVRLKNDCY